MSNTVETETQVQRLTGKVKWFNNKAGFGFITICDGTLSGQDIFVHYSSIRVENSQYKYLVQGEYVDFNLVKSDNSKYEYLAMDVTGVKNGSIMCETRNVTEVAQRPRIGVRRYKTRPPNDSARMEESRDSMQTEVHDEFVKVQKKVQRQRTA